MIEEWELFYGPAQRMGLTLRVAGVELDMAVPPTTDGLHQLLCRSARIPLDEVKRHPHGAVFADPAIVVEPKEAGWTNRLQVGDPTMMAELAQVAAEPLTGHAGYRPDDDFGYRLVSRRLLEVYNSSGRDLAPLARRRPTNPAFMHPDDLTAEGLNAGDVIEIDSGHATILGEVEPAPDVRRGVISMAHAWGDAPKHDSEVRTLGANTGRLTSVERDYDPVTGLPVMSAIPVNARHSDESLV